MGIYIKGMEMPRNCGECPFLHPGTAYGKVFPCVCWAKGFPIKPSERDLRDGLCPLVKVPVPHGRLGDLDKLIEKIDGIWDCNDMVFSPNDHCCNVPEDCKGCKWIETKNFIRRMVANTPTIIPAEEGE